MATRRKKMLEKPTTWHFWLRQRVSGSWLARFTTSFLLRAIEFFVIQLLSAFICWLMYSACGSATATMAKVGCAAECAHDAADGNNRIFDILRLTPGTRDALMPVVQSLCVPGRIGTSSSLLVICLRLPDPRR